MSLTVRLVLLALAVAVAPVTGLVADDAKQNVPPEGYTALFNGKDLSGWRGLNMSPYKLADMSEADRDAMWKKNWEDVTQHWSVDNGELVNDGHGVYLTTAADYTNYDLWIDYKTVAKADSGIYLKATPQVQIWDYTDEGKFKLGADKGSGGLWNNNPGNPGKDPLVLADKPFGEWNRFHIRQIGARTWVWLNGKLVVDGAIHDNYWDRTKPLIPSGPIQLQTHGGEIRWRNIFLHEIGAEEAASLLAGSDDGFQSIFNGKDFEGWAGPTENYEVVDGTVRCKQGKGGTIYWNETLTDFVARLEFKVPPGGNNGLAIRYPGSGDTAYVGMCELQVLDNTADKYAKLDPRQYHGSIYGAVAAHRGYQRPVGEWNYQEVTVKGSRITVELNGTVITDADVSEVKEFMGKTAHTGINRKDGFFGFAGHGDAVQFRNVRIKKLQ
ncbi:DUF1080 domain-containing protein [bacterium]|nr:DUF1080 domain-containing protein [bacterium]